MSEQTPGNIGKYQCILRVGQGGMGEVFLGVASGPGGFSKLNIIKRLRQDMAADEGFVEMFLNEARLAGRLSHPNIVQTREVGIEGNAYFIVMEYLEGQTLFSVLRKVRRGARGSSSLSPSPESRPSVQTASDLFDPAWSGPRSRRMSSAGFSLAMHMQIVSDALAGLHHAHEAQDFAGHPLNMIHRDVAPSNIFVTYEGQVKVLDFGIAKAADSGNSTRVGTFKGKVAYMAPEQFVQGPIDRRCDIFAAGATLWEAAAGTRLWRGLSDVEIFRHLAEGQIPRPSTIAPNVDPRLEAICMRALAFDRNYRYATAEEFRRDLDELIDEFGRPTREDLGQVVTELFAAERAHTNALVETKLRALRENTVSGSLKMGEGYVGVVAAEPNTSATTPVDSTPPPSRKGRRAAVVGVALIAVGGIAAVGWRMSKPLPATSVEPVATTTASSELTSTAAAPSVTGAPSSLRIEIAATPTTAMLFLDDARLPANPYVATVSPDASSHTLRVEAPGYRSQTDFVQFSGTAPIKLRVDLVKLKAAPAWVPPRKSPPRQSVTEPAPPPAPPPSASAPASTAPTARPPRPKPFEIDQTDPYKK